MGTRGCIPASSVFQDDYFATSSRGTPRKPLLIRFVMKKRQSDCKTEEEVPTRENASEEAMSLEESNCNSSFRGLPCWSVTGRRGRKTKQSAAPTERDNEVENAAKILLPQMSPMVTESPSEESTNLDPRLEDNEAESDTSTQNTNLMEVASSNGDVETSTYRAKGKSIMIPEVDTGTWFLNSTHNAAELEAGHQNGNMATLSKKEDESCRELEIYELSTLKLAVNISNKDVKGKGIMSPISVSEISNWSENPIQNISELLATDDKIVKMACSSTKEDKKRKRRGLEIKNTSEGNGSKEGYICNICNNSFSTYQALGGHKTFHTKHKSILADTSSGKDGHDIETKLPHQCSVCNKTFQTGQKLGGHMRAHFKGTLSSKRVKHNAQEYGSSSATAARDKSPDGSSSQSVNDIAPTAAVASLSEDTTKNSHTTAASSSSLAAGNMMTEMVLRPHDFDLNELPMEGDILAASSSPTSSSSDTPAANVTLDLTLSL